MATEVIRGIVLKEMPKGETSKQIIVLAKEKGKIWITAKGARKQKSKLLILEYIFLYTIFVVFSKATVIYYLVPYP